MSYTLRGRFESRLAGLVLPLAVACVLAAALGAWWPLELAAAMVAVLLGLDVAYHPLLRYQPGWAALPLGVLELGAVVGIVTLFDVQPPLSAALAIFAGGWIAAQLLGHALLPLWRLSYAEDGGELGRVGPLLALAVATPFLVGATYWYANLPPVVHLSAGIHHGPIFIDRREHLVGDGNAVVVGGIVIRHSDVTISGIHVLGGQNGITVEGYRNVVLKHVTVAGAALDGIHVRRAAVRIEDCAIDMTGSRYGQGIDISYTSDKGETVVHGCTIVGGLEGIVTHSSMAMLTDNHVEGTSLRAIDMTEMSMGSVMDNVVDHADGVGINCGDHSMCMITGNKVSGTRRDDAGGDRTRAGIGLEVEFGAEAETSRNDLGSNPTRVGVFLDSQLRSLNE